MAYVGLACPCGQRAFRVAGRPRTASGPGSLFWRTLSRVWRDARQPLVRGEPVESPYLPPLSLVCGSCEREGEVLGRAGASEPAVAQGPPGPLEAHRCRACRRASMEVVVGIAEADAGGSASPADRTVAAELVARCRACGRQARLAWFDERPSAQQIQLDRLYGRR